VPGDAKLWRALHKPDQYYKDSGKPKPSFFRDKNGLSCDLARLSTPARSKLGHGPKPYPPGSGLVEFTAERVRAAGSDVSHEPVKLPRQNYAHAQLSSTLDGTGADLLAKAATYVIKHDLKR